MVIKVVSPWVEPDCGSPEISPRDQPRFAVHSLERLLMDIKTFLATTGLAVVALATSAVAFAATEAQINSRVSETLVDFNAINTANKPLVNKAAGVLVFPRIT